jgi:hypothetical protein
MLNSEGNSRRDAVMTKAVAEYKSPAHKLISMLHVGRDKLRLKYASVRVNLRTAQNQVRAVAKSREMWRHRAEAAEAKLSTLEKKMTAPRTNCPSIIAPLSRPN